MCVKECVRAVHTIMIASPHWRAVDNILGTDFPVKDTGIEGDKVDAYFEIRPESDYRLGIPHKGTHEKECMYKSDVVVQDLNPKFASVAIDLQRLCNMKLDAKILLDFWDRDRFSKNDFMSYIETTVRELLEQAGKKQGMRLMPPPAPHQQAVGELWVDKAEMQYPVVYISELRGKLTVANAKLTAAACFTMLCQGEIKKSTKINLTNEVGRAECLHLH